MKVISKIYTVLIFVFLYAPIAVLIAFSFNSTKSRAVFSGFTFKWYESLFQNSEIFKAILVTLQVAIVASILSTILGVIAAVIISKSSKKVGALFSNVTNFPMLNPEIVMGVSLMMLFVFLSGIFSFLSMGVVTLILAHTTFCTPYVMLNVLPKLRQSDNSMYEAAIDLGCTPVKAFLKVVFPDVKPAVITGAIMAFTISIDDFVISYFTSGTVQNLSITIYSMTRKLVTPEINALSTILFVAVLLLLVVINIRQTQEEKRRGAVKKC
ncbi:MAG: ABC transporter permease [Clostridia bacterium]|nr:ABC transporter permease [Clostridia bacterium]